MDKKPETAASSCAITSTPLLDDLVSSADRLAEYCVKTYFGYQVVAYTTANSLKHYSLFPWNFAIRDEFRWRHYYGIPNKVETRAKALRRAWYRAKWLKDGTYDQHYKPFPSNPKLTLDAHGASVRSEETP